MNREFGKIGKSLKNMITPDDLIEEFGADTLRLYEMFTGPARAEPPVGDQGRRRRVPPAAAHLAHRPRRGHRRAPRRPTTPPDEETLRVLHRSIAAVRDGMETLRFNTSIARITELNNHLTVEATRTAGCRAPVAEAMVLMLAPLAPHAAEELWRRLGHPESLAWEPFPEADPAYLVDDTIEIPVQVNGKVRAKIQVAAGLDAAALEAAARADAKVAELLADADGPQGHRRPRQARQLRRRLTSWPPRRSSTSSATRPREVHGGQGARASRRPSGSARSCCSTTTSPAT